MGEEITLQVPATINFTIMLARYIPHRRTRVFVLIIAPLLLAWILFVQASWRPRVIQTGGEPAHFSRANDGTLKATKSPFRANLKDGSGAILDLAFSSDGKTLALGRQITINGLRNKRRWAYAAGQIQLRSVKTGAITQTLPFVKSNEDTIFELYPPYRKLVFSPDGKKLLAGSMENSVVLFDAAKNRVIHSKLRVYSDKCYPVGFSPDSKTAIYAERDKVGDYSLMRDDPKRKPVIVPVTLVHVSTSDGKISKRATLKVIDGFPQQFALFPDGKTAACAVTWSDGNAAFAVNKESEMPGVVIFDVSTGKIAKKIKPDYDAITAITYSNGVADLAVSPNGYWLATSSSGGPVNKNFLSIINVSSSQISETSGGKGDHIRKLAFAPNGKTLATLAGNGFIETWKVRRHSLYRVLGQHQNAYAIAFSPDGKTVASAGSDGTVRLFRAESIQLFPQSALQVLAAHFLTFYSLKIKSPTSSRLFDCTSPNQPIKPKRPLPSSSFNATDNPKFAPARG